MIIVIEKEMLKKSANAIGIERIGFQDMKQN
jgi:hypothetical protein